MKTKTLVKTLTSFHIIPSGENQEDFGGDLLPEAIVIKNILEGMHSSLETLMRLRTLLLDGEGDFAQLVEAVELDPRLKERLLTLRDQLLRYVRSEDYFGQKPSAAAVTFTLGGGEESDARYDGDTEAPPTGEGDGGDEEVFARLAAKRKERRAERKRRLHRMKSSSTTATLKREATIDLGHFRQEELDFVSTAREILLMGQNERCIALSLKEILRCVSYHDDDNLAGFMRLLDLVHQFSKDRVMVPFKIYMQDVQDLCSSINLHQKYDKICRKLRSNLQDIEKAREQVMKEKLAEKEELEAAIATIREDSLSRIRAHIGQVDNRIRVVAWNSHARRTKTMEHVHELKLELDEAVEEHSRAETTMRHENLKLEAEVDEMIRRYDREMFERYNAIQALKAEYTRERRELREIEEKLEVVEEQRSALEEENRLAQEKKIHEELDRIRRIVAVKVIQRMWRAYKARKLLKSKKKKRKHRRKQ